MKSLYKRQLFMMVAIVFLSFFMLSAAFMMLSYRYIIAEKRDAMERNADYIASFTSEYIQQSGSLDVYFRSYVATLASVSDSNVLLSDVDGDIIYASGGSSSDLSNYTDSRIPQRVLQQVLSSGSYNGLTNLDGIYSEKRYLAAYPFGIIFGGATIPQGLVLVSSDTSSVSEMWRATATIFFFTAVTVLLIAVIASSITSSHQVRPLNEMAEAARKFGQGEFDVRVTGYENRCDEVGTLAEAFNSMAASPVQGGDPAQRVHRQCLPRAQDPHDHHLRLCGRASWTAPSPGAGTGLPWRSSSLRPAACPGWCGGCWTCPASML